jgi:response regulator RpfG family c-di-GMP phosphodiesterase
MKGVLVVDDEGSIRDSLGAYLGKMGYQVETCADGESALEAFRRRHYPLVLTDIMMPGISGEDLLRSVKELDPTAEVVMMTGYATIHSAVSTIKAGAYDYIVKPFKMEDLLHILEKAMVHRNLVRENKRLQENSLNVLRAMVNVLEQRDAYTAGHSQRVTEITLAIARAMGLDEIEVEVLNLAGQIHDLGKIGIEDNILRKPGPLSDDEYAVIKTHPEKAKQIIEPLDFLKETIPIILHHHERFDGSGYPGGLRGSSIPLGSRIVTVADTYDAITSSRAYRSARGVDAAVEELERCRGTQFDPDIVDVFAGMAVRDRFPRGGGSGATTGGREQVL